MSPAATHCAGLSSARPIIIAGTDGLPPYLLPAVVPTISHPPDANGLSDYPQARGGRGTLLAPCRTLVNRTPHLPPLARFYSSGCDGTIRRHRPVILDRPALSKSTAPWEIHYSRWEVYNRDFNFVEGTISIYTFRANGRLLWDSYEN